MKYLRKKLVKYFSFFSNTHFKRFFGESEFEIKYFALINNISSYQFYYVYIVRKSLELNSTFELVILFFFREEFMKETQSCVIFWIYPRYVIL